VANCALACPLYPIATGLRTLPKVCVGPKDINDVVSGHCAEKKARPRRCTKVQDDLSRGGRSEELKP
jgi:hypothetical protein